MSKANSPSAAAPSLKELLLLPAVYAYFSGFLYQYYYHRSFGISLQVLEIPVYYYFVYAFTVVNTHRLATVAVLVALLLLYRSATNGRRAARVGLVIALAVLFPVIWVAARDTGSTLAGQIRRGHGTKEIRFQVAPEMADQLSMGAFTQANSEGRLDLIVETSDTYFVLLQDEGTTGVLPAARVFEVQKKNVSLSVTKIY